MNYSTFSLIMYATLSSIIFSLWWIKLNLDTMRWTIANKILVQFKKSTIVAMISIISSVSLFLNRLVLNGLSPIHRIKRWVRLISGFHKKLNTVIQFSDLWLMYGTSLRFFKIQIVISPELVKLKSSGFQCC